MEHIQRRIVENQQDIEKENQKDEEMRLKVDGGKGVLAPKVVNPVFERREPKHQVFSSYGHRKEKEKNDKPAPTK